MSALRTGRPLLPRNIILLLLVPFVPGRYIVLIYVRRLVNSRAIVRLEGLGALKTFIHLIGTGTRDLPACSIAPQKCAHTYIGIFLIAVKICGLSMRAGEHVSPYTFQNSSLSYTRHCR
jgi:hypothetical protein